MPSNLLQEAANTLLQDTQDFFKLGSVNNSSIEQSNKQFAFINKIREDFLVQYKQSCTTQFFFKPEAGKKISIRKKGDLKKDYQNYLEMQSFESILKLLRNIYSDIEIKKDYKDCENKDWKNDWFNDFPQILAMSELQKRYKKEEDEDPKRAIQMKLYNQLCKNSIPNSGSARSLYFEETITQLQAIAQFGGAGNCEPMAEYCLMIAIEKNKNLNLNCAIRYIRFPACENYEVLNVVALGEWPNKGCQIICPWLGTITEWQGSLKETKEFKHYNDSKIIFEVRIGKEMDALSQRLRDIQFTEQTTNTSKKSAENFKQKAKELENSFDTYFPELRADSSYHCKR